MRRNLLVVPDGCAGISRAFIYTLICILVRWFLDKMVASRVQFRWNITARLEIWTNTFGGVNKRVWGFGQTRLEVWTNTFGQTGLVEHVWSNTFGQTRLVKHVWTKPLRLWTTWYHLVVRMVVNRSNMVSYLARMVVNRSNMVSYLQHGRTRISEW